MYVITVEVDGEREQFLAIDHDSGYPYWSQWLGSAKIYKTEREARDMLEGDDFNRIGIPGYPPRMIHSGLGLCNAKMSGEGMVAIKQIKLEIVDFENVSAAITA